LRLTRQILNDTQRVIEEIELRRKPGLRALREELGAMADRVRQVVKQAKARIFDGITQLPGKIVSLFEPHSEIIRKGKASQPTEFGKLVQLSEAENQIVTHYDVFDQRPSDRELLTEAVAEQPAAGTRAADGDRRCRLLCAKPRASPEGNGREMGGGAESQHS
jgi:IS5 family transposase